MQPSRPQMSSSESLDALAAQHAAGAFSADELTELHVDETVWEAALGEWDPTVELLATGITPEEPASAIKQKLLTRIAAGKTSPEALSIVRSTEVWRPMGPPGISFRLLFADRVQRRMTIQLRAEPGARIPSHKHRGVEECFIFEGDLTDGEHTFYAGDYFRCESGSHHEDQTTQQGCICLLMTAYNPLLVAAADA